MVLFLPSTGPPAHRMRASMVRRPRRWSLRPGAPLQGRVPVLELSRRPTYSLAGRVTVGEEHMARRARRGHLLVVTFVGIVCVLAAAAAGSASFDWPAYLFGSTHSSANLAAGAITPQNANSLVRAWNWIPDP